MEAVLHEASSGHQHHVGAESVTLQSVENEKNALDVVVNKDASVQRSGKMFTHQLQKEPIDITFENVTFTASMGLRKSMDNG